MKSEKTNLSINLSTFAKGLRELDKAIQAITEERDGLAYFQSKIIEGVSQEIPGILDKMDGETKEEKIYCLANKIREIVRINRKGSLSCVMVDNLSNDKLRVGFNVKEGGRYITISASGTNKRSRRLVKENATEFPIGYISLSNGEVILHFYENKENNELNIIKITSCVNLGNANDGE